MDNKDFFFFFSVSFFFFFMFLAQQNPHKYGLQELIMHPARSTAGHKLVYFKYQIIPGNTRLDRVEPGPSSPSQVSAENIIYEDFVLIGDLRWNFSALLQWRKKKVETSEFFILSALWYFPFPSAKHWIEALPNSSNQNKGFQNYVFCRNWAV